MSLNELQNLPNPTGDRTSLLQTLTERFEKLLVFTPSKLVDTIAWELEGAGIAVERFRQMAQDPLEQFASLEQGVIVASTSFCYGWRCDARAFVFVDAVIDTASAPFLQAVTRTRQRRRPYFIDCTISRHRR